jgi:metal-sulfur cluster biosynthetic enzyme
VEEIDAVPTPPRARVEDTPVPAESAGEKLERKKDYLEGFLSQQPTGLAPNEPGGETYEAVIGALKEIYDPEIPVNIYELGLIYGVDITLDGAVAITMTLTTPNCPVAESMPGEVELRVAAVPGSANAR